MYRVALEELKAWRSSPVRKPLLLRGARQVGKSWIVREFGRAFTHFVEINFEKQPEAGKLFEGDLDVKNLLEKLAIYTRHKIIPGETLLFLDEIQECPRALTALRYFKEELPELHVIAAGSLIDFVLEDIGMAVGRIQFLYLYPLSFSEFLGVQDRQDL
jgi:predicted AAA+ superfamily ATPase